MTDDTTGAGTVLVAPDSRLSAVADTLVEHGVPIHQRCEAVDDIEGVPDCVVVLDAPATDGRSEVNGLALLEQATDRFDCPVVVYTRREGYESVKAPLDAGAADVIRVPVKRGALIARRVAAAAGYGPEFQASDDQLRSLLRSFPHTLFLKDDLGRFANVTTHTAGNYGFTRDQLIGMTDYELFSESHADELWAEERRIIRTGRPKINNIESFIDDDGDGERRWASTTKVPRHDEDGEVIGIVGGTQDVTPAKQQEALMAALHQASRELSRATSKSDIATTTVDIASEIDYLPPVQVVLETDTGELKPIETGRDEASPEIYDRYETAYERAADSGETLFVDADGQVTTETTTVVDPVFEGEFATGEVAIVIPLGGHGVLGMVAPDGSVDEFTNKLAHVLASNVAAAFDRAERERKLARKNRQLEEFATLGAHELRNRLQIALANVMQERTVAGDSDRLVTVERTLEGMDRLLTQLLRLARTGKIPRTTESVDIRRAADRAWRDVGADDGGVDFSPPESVPITANPDALTELFEFLFRNSVEHAGEDVSIDVGVFEGGFYVEDDGVGIPAEMQADLFDVQYADAAHDTGYGLYIVAEIVEAHDWEIAVSDGAEGGARFEITGVERHSSDGVT